MLPKQNVCKLNFFFFLFCPLFFVVKTSSEQWIFLFCFLIIITCFCFCSVNIISWFTWVSLFNNVLFFLLFSIFLCFFSIFSDLTWACTRFLNDSLNERGWCCTCVSAGVSVWFMCMCVSRAISGVGCFALFFVYYIFLNFSLCFIYGARLLYLVG